MVRFCRPILCSLFCIISFSIFSQESGARLAEKKLLTAFSYIQNFYVEREDMEKIAEKSVIEMLKTLDPHSVYYSAKEVDKANEPLEGKFDGIGVAFQLLKDTITIVEVISGGPSEKLGILAGDKIISIDNKPATGDSITNSFVFNNLRGKKGTIVDVAIVRKGILNPIPYKITRGEIPIHSIDTYFMIDNNTGYIRLDRFSRTTMDELNTVFGELKKQGLKDLIFDLRGNGGGYLDVAVYLANEFLSKDKLIVYTEGVSSPKQTFMSIGEGGFSKGKLVILIDEGSASASEIVSGAIQDWDRGVIVGRRSFGKGLVQRIFNLPDRSQIRLTTSRYYTPAGRCIQKPYDDGIESYYNDYMKRFNHKELITADSIKFPDSLKYYTHAKRVVYGGGGIMPDVFVPIDTLRASDYLINLRSKGIFNNFSLEWTNKNRTNVLKKYPKCEDFLVHYNDFSIMNEFENFVEENGISQTSIKKEWVLGWISSYIKEEIKDTSKKAEYTNYENYAKNILNDKALMDEILKKAAKEDAESKMVIEKSNESIKYTLKALIARNLYGTKYYYKVTSEIDNEFNKALEIIKNENLYNSLITK